MANVELILENFWRYFLKKIRLTPKKYRPKGETSLNLVTQNEAKKRFAQNSSARKVTFIYFPR
jgi:hypothetical protein